MSKLFDTIYYRYICPHPIITAFVVALLIDGVISAWGKPRPVAEFFEQIIAETLHWGSFIGTFAAAYYIFCFTEKRTGEAWIAFLACVAAFLLTGLATSYLVHIIPGIGWRIDGISSYNDY